MIDSYNGPSDFTPIRSIPWDSSWPELAGEDDRRYLFSYMENRFGIPENLFDDYLLFNRKRSWWLLANSPPVMWASSLKVSMIGLRAFQRVADFIKPTTRMIQIFGKAATRSKLEIDEQQLKQMGAGDPILVDLELENGYVILSLKGQILGLGLYINGRVHSQLPRKDLALFNKGDFSGG